MSPTERFEHYEVLRRDDGTLWELGRGAMGVTYKAWDTDLHCTVALKVVHPGLLETLDIKERFVREARAAAKLHHPNIATVFRLGRAEDDTHFYAMEFCEGPTLQDAVAQCGHFEAKLALEVALQVSKALVVGENQRIVHRDLKPSNLILSERPGEGMVVKVIDFGVAKSLVAAGSSMAAATMGGFVGTAQFASPEQLEEHDVDIRSDIYSLGVCLWFMLTGRPVFEGSMARVMAQTLSAEPEWDQLSGQSPGLISLLKRLLAKDRDLRPAGAASLREDLDFCASQLSDVPSTRTRPKAILSGTHSRNAPIAADAGTALQRQPPVQSREPIATPSTASGLLLDRYQWVNEIARDGLGTLGTGWDRRNRKERVTLRLFDPGTLAVPSVQRIVDRRIDALRQNPHPALPVVLDFAEYLGEWVLATDLQDDARGVNLLRARGALPLSEVILLLAPLASALDHGETSKMELPSLALHRIVIAFRSPNLKIDDVLRRPISEWPEFVVKLDAPVFEDTDSGDASATMSSMRTQAGHTPAGQPGLPDSRAASLARVIYELMGGTLQTNGYTPLAKLSEAGNGLLRRAINGDFGVAMDVVEALKAHVGYEAPTTHAPSRAQSSTASSSPRPQRLKFVKPAGALAGLLTLVLLYHYGIQQPQDKERDERAAKAEKDKRDLEEKYRSVERIRLEAEALKAKVQAEQERAAALAKAGADAKARVASRKNDTRGVC